MADLAKSTRAGSKQLRREEEQTLSSYQTASARTESMVQSVYTDIKVENAIFSGISSEESERFTKEFVNAITANKVKGEEAVKARMEELAPYILGTHPRGSKKKTYDEAVTARDEEKKDKA